MNTTEYVKKFDHIVCIVCNSLLNHNIYIQDIIIKKTAHMLTYILTYTLIILDRYKTTIIQLLITQK